MSKRTHLHPSDLQGLGRLSIEAVTQVTHLVESLHHTITQTPAPLGAARPGATAGITGLVYRSIRGVTALVGGTLEMALARLQPLLRADAPALPSAEREAVLAALNGVLGDHLAASGNPLAITMRLRCDGLVLQPAAVADAGSKIAVLVHGLCMNDRQWGRLRGASDAGIYVGQSENIIVRRNRVFENVAGIEIENSNHAEVTENLATRNTGGILVFDLPGLPKVGGGSVLIARNAVIDNNTDNFAPEGNIVASVPAGTGVMVMANRQVHIQQNALVNNGTAHILLTVYSRDFSDERYEPRPVDILVSGNIYGRAGFAPDIPGGADLTSALGGDLPAIITDGRHQDLKVWDLQPVLSLGLTEMRQAFDQANPAVTVPDIPQIFPPVASLSVSLPKEMEARLK